MEVLIPPWPPGNPWDAYVLFIVWYPFLLRAILIGRPTVMVLRKLAPHRSWILSRLRDLPVKGLGILITNEVIAMLAPPLVVLSFRLLSDPVGWSTWEETPIGGASLLLLLLSIWIAVDVARILRLRRLLRSVLKRNIKRLVRVTETALTGRRWLRRFGRRDQNESVGEGSRSNRAIAEDAAKQVGKRGLIRWGYRAVRYGTRLTPMGLMSAVAADAAVELGRQGAKKGAGILADRIDRRIQSEFDRIHASSTKMLLQQFARDMAMATLPLILLGLLPVLF